MTTSTSSKNRSRRELYRRRREIVRRAQQRAKGALVLVFFCGVAFGYTWAANAYGQHLESDRPEFQVGPAIVHHAPSQFPAVPATGSETGL